MLERLSRSFFWLPDCLSVARRPPSMAPFSGGLRVSAVREERGVFDRALHAVLVHVEPHPDAEAHEVADVDVREVHVCKLSPESAPGLPDLCAQRGETGGTGVKALGVSLRVPRESNGLG